MTAIDQLNTGFAWNASRHCATHSLAGSLVAPIGSPARSADMDGRIAFHQFALVDRRQFVDRPVLVPALSSSSESCLLAWVIGLFISKC